MDGLGIVYLIENAQQFWSGALSRYPHQRGSCRPLLTLMFRARRHSQSTRKCFPIPPRCYTEALDSFLRLVSRCVIDSPPVVLRLSLAPAEQYLQSPLQLEHACDFILDSELFAFHSERMCEILTDEAAGVSSTFFFLACLAN